MPATPTSKTRSTRDAEHAHRLGALLGHRQVARPGAHERDGPVPSGGMGVCSSVRRAGERQVLQRRERAHTSRALSGVEARDEDVLPGARELPRDADDLLGVLRLREDHLGHPLAQPPVVVDDGVAQVGERQVLQLGDGLFDARRPR